MSIIKIAFGVLLLFVSLSLIGVENPSKIILLVICVALAIMGIRLILEGIS